MIKLKKSDLKEFLDVKVNQYNNPKFIETDPIQIPHLFSIKEDIEISSFLISTISWGNRKMIIKNGYRMMELMDNSPFDFVMNHKESDLEKLNSFIHRTFNGTDFIGFVNGLKHLYKVHDGLEGVFTKYQKLGTLQPAIVKLKELFFEAEHLPRTQKHISNPLKGSSAKRINMCLRWLIRSDNAGVDFGLWKNIPSSSLSCPLDVHSGNVARKLGLLKRTQNDAKALVELDNSLRKLDSNDPVKYDFALFGLGVFEKF
jgi:uncharacterized protein (TIGR02757 family)